MSTTKSYTRICTQCNTPFQTEKRRARICSDACWEASYKGRTAHLNRTFTKACAVCGKEFTKPLSRATALYCSRECKNIGIAKKNTGTIRTSQWTTCDYCGKTIKQYKSRSHRKYKFCNESCFHKWDAWYKGQASYQAAQAESRAKAGIVAVSKVENAVANWLDQHGIAYTRQAVITKYSMDFQVGNVYIEVQGCYWHGCTACYSELTPRQKKRTSRDKAKATYCRNRGIKLYCIWEHDVQKDDFSALMPLLSE